MIACWSDRLLPVKLNKKFNILLHIFVRLPKMQHNSSVLFLDLQNENKLIGFFLTITKKLEFLKNIKYRDFPGGPVAKTLHSQCRGPRFDPWSWN